jgi:FemAB-related protein (PEP-CTERM system-associated)
MTIKLVTSTQQDDWNNFVISNTQSAFYHLYQWKTIIERCFKFKTFYCMALKDQQIQGILPLVLCDNIIFGRKLVSMPFLNFGGVCAVNQEAEVALLQRAKLITSRTRAKYLELRHTRRIDEQLPVKTNKVSMTINLTPGYEKIWEKFSGNLRTEIRKAKTFGLEVRSGKEHYLDAFYHVFSRNYKIFGTPAIQKRFFRLILEELSRYIKIFVVYFDDHLVGVAMNGYFKDTVEGMWAGSLSHIYPKLRINYLLYWEMIKDACQNAYSYFHLGRSTKDSGAQKFKEKWLAEPKQLYWEYYLNSSKKLPQLNVDNPNYQLPIKIWRRLPLNVTRMIGPVLASGLP